jgi:hypothetical protein
VKCCNVAVTRNIANSHFNEVTLFLYVKTPIPLLQRDILGDAHLSYSHYIADLVDNILVATNI